MRWRFWRHSAPDELHDIRKAFTLTGTDKMLVVKGATRGNSHNVDARIVNNRGVIECNDCDYQWAGRWH